MSTDHDELGHRQSPTVVNRIIDITISDRSGIAGSLEVALLVADPPEAKIPLSS
jgi:hypothetical protein